MANNFNGRLAVRSVFHAYADDLKTKLRTHFETVLSKQKKFTYNQPIKIADIK